MTPSKQALPRGIRRRYDAPDKVLMTATSDFPDYDRKALQNELRSEIENATGEGPDVLTHWRHKLYLRGPEASSWLDADGQTGNWWSRPLVWRSSSVTAAVPGDPDGGQLLVAVWGPDAPNLVRALQDLIDRYEAA
jgi:hypothetical protein